MFRYRERVNVINIDESNRLAMEMSTACGLRYNGKEMSKYTTSTRSKLHYHNNIPQAMTQRWARRPIICSWKQISVKMSLHQGTC